MIQREHSAELGVAREQPLVRRAGRASEDRALAVPATSCPGGVVVDARTARAGRRGAVELAFDDELAVAEQRRGQPHLGDRSAAATRLLAVRVRTAPSAGRRPALAVAAWRASPGRGPRTAGRRPQRGCRTGRGRGPSPCRPGAGQQRLHLPGELRPRRRWRAGSAAAVAPLAEDRARRDDEATPRLRRPSTGRGRSSTRPCCRACRRAGCRRGRCRPCRRPGPTRGPACRSR